MGEAADSYTSTALLRVAGEPKRLRVRSVLLSRLGPHASEHRFDTELVRIGSAPDNDLVVFDPAVSRAHCRIFLEGGRFVIQDERSKNGTFVNDVPIREAFLLPGMKITLGGVVYRFETAERDETIRPSRTAKLGELVGTSPSMREAFGLIERIAGVDSTVVVFGETGTGKELVARALHDLSRRKEGPFTVVDCGAISPTLIESELFGHERGAFTGALDRKIGSFEQSDGGTVFLDEIGELPMELQVKLLRVLERHEIKRVGGEGYLPIDVRVVAATHRDLGEMVEAGAFRRDLLYRLEVVTIHMPPLRERLEDVALLVRHFLRASSFNRGPDGERKTEHVSPLAMQALTAYPWPGNVRELKHAIERAVGLGDSDTITIGDLPPRVVSEEMVRAEKEPGGTFKDAKRAWVDAFASDYLTRLLERHGGDVNAAAVEADLHPKYMRQLMMQYELGPYGD
ncbi:MAG: sigma 54-interacting transcriptional regulator [Sandaracinaceae bacterium]|nr:sigma 54-interacting transcriptional regulator [Sandaracinaceae bacterium]